MIQSFQDGATPEAIAQRYPTATLIDLYGVIAYYLRHRTAMDTYLAMRERQAETVQKRIEEQQRDTTELRNRLLATRGQLVLLVAALRQSHRESQHEPNYD